MLIPSPSIRRTIRAAIFCFAFCVLLSGAPRAEDTNRPSPLEGRWNVTVVGPHGDFPAWLEIRKSGVDALVGTYVGQFGSARPIGKIETRSDGFRFSVPPQWERTPQDHVFEGQYADGRLSGETNGGTGTTMKWTAVRAPTLEREQPPEWASAIELFNGKDLTGWKVRFDDRENGWLVKDGILTNAKPGNDLLTDAKFDDFRLIAEFRYPEGSNSGIFLRGRYEVQIDDHFGRSADSHHIGGVYGHLTPSVNAAKPAGEWQLFEITLVGRAVTVVLNGERVIDRQAIPGNTGGGLDNDEASPGPIVLQGDHGPVEFRRITITPAK